MHSLGWQPELEPRAQLDALIRAASDPGLVVVVFPPCPREPELPWGALEPWVRSRAVTVADVEGDLSGSAVSVALCCDLVFLRRGARVHLGDAGDPPSPGVLWALGRAGAEALARGVLADGWLTASEAVRLGVARAELEAAAPLPLPAPCSLPALTAARDLLRCTAVGSSALALEMATFRLLFATGHPREGATAFLEGREPQFP